MTSDNIPEYSVSELSGKLKRTIEDTYGYVRVRGELGRVTRAASGHVYLDLKDERAVISSVMWKGTAARQTVKPEQGLEVVATGRMSTFPGQSRYQLIIDTLAPAGAGALMALYEERKKKLAAEGLFAPERKRPIPRLPRRIGVVTSPSGAVIRDILHRLRDRFPSHVIVWPSVVQGEGAPAQIVRGIKGLALLPEETRPDVIIVARGGGSLEDLWCFNDEEVVRAAAASPIPLISAVGHETDTTLIDYAADLRAPTPTAAAELAVPVRTELLSDVANLEGRLIRQLTAQTEGARLRLQAAARGLGSPQALVEPAIQRLDRAEEQLRNAAGRAISQRELRLSRVAPRL
ncbi:MAG: exodeoxyribonuclease VII large subunit, partial [Pseudomonadota bacterium]